MVRHRTALIAITASWAAPAFAETPAAREPAVAGPQVGAEQDAGETQGYGDIIVTAQKRSESLRDVPMTITALSGDQLQARGISDAADLAKATPGFSYVESGQSVPVYSLRGVGFFDTSIGARPTVSVYLDQMPLTFSIMTAGSAFDLERVEILKGPQGTLFGSNATGGAINYIAAKPKPSFEAGIAGSYGRFNTAELSGYVTGPLAPNLNARIAVRGVRSDGWQRSYTRDDSLGEQRFIQGRLLLDWSPSDTVRFNFNANGFIDKSDTQAGQLIAVAANRPQNLNLYPLLGSYPLSPRDNRAADWDPNTDFSRDNRFYQLSLRGEIDLSDSVTLTSLTSYADMAVRQLVDIDGISLNNGKILTIGDASSFTQELRLSGSLGAARWIVGGNYSKDKSFEDGHSDFLYTTAAAGFLPFPGRFQANNATGSQDFDTYAVFGNVDYEIGHFVLHGGARYSKADLTYATCSRTGDAASAAALTGFFNLLRGLSGRPAIAALGVGQCLSLDGNLMPGLLAGELSEDNVSWRAGLDWKPARDTLLYVSVSQGYKSGNSPVLNAFAQAALRPVTQESVLAYEAGLKVALADRKVDLSAAAFYYDYRNKQMKGRSFQPPSVLGAIESLVNVPKSRIYGFEGQANLYPVEGLTVSVGATYLDSKVLGSFPNFSLLGAATDFGGDAFPYTPQWQVSSDVAYEHPLGEDMKGFVGGSLSYRSATTAGFGTEAVLRIDDYALLDLRAGIKSQDGRWRVELFGRNVTNSYYWTNVARAFDVVRRLAGKPATYGITVGYKFR
jgi:outer membrane receptor protein involved in Fe transport